MNQVLAILFAFSLLSCIPILWVPAVFATSEEDEEEEETEEVGEDGVFDTESPLPAPPTPIIDRLTSIVTSILSFQMISAQVTSTLPEKCHI